MAYVDNLSDVRLKPRLLHSLLRDRLPDDSRPLSDPSDLLAIASHVKVHALLSESSHSPLPPKLADSWRAAVDAWVKRSSDLASSKMPAKCWTGTYLLGVTCGECTEDRFLKSYPDWFQKLLSNFQSFPDSQVVTVASCASLLDLFTRLAEIPAAKKDAASLSAKVVQSLMQLLNEDSSGSFGSIWAVNLLCVLLHFFPSSVHRHTDKVEAVIVSKIMSGKSSEALSKKLASCLALLPKAKGDEASWSLMLKKVLITINKHLDDAFQGLEEGNVSSDMMKLLILPGDDILPPLGGLVADELSKHSVNWRQKLLVARLSTLMQCCALMVTNSYPVQVTIPIQSMLKLVRRVLSVDGTLRESMLPSITPTHQENLCLVLPILHVCCLDLLFAIIKGLRSQLLPHAASIAQTLIDFFGKSSMPSVRLKIYQVAQLMISRGAGMALYLSQAVINNAFFDLNSSGHGICATDGNSMKVESELSFQNAPRKRKHASETPNKSQNNNSVEVHPCCKKAVGPISVQIAALGALEALVTVGGSLKSESWRSDVDLLLIGVARNACDAAQGRDFSPFDELTVSRADFPLAALRTLLASLLSPAHVRPPHLSLGLEVFFKGKQGANSNIAAFCAHALLSLEVLIHPRALPLPRSSDGNSYHDAVGKNRFKDHIFHKYPGVTVTPVSTFHENKTNEMNINDDDLYDIEQESREDNEVTIATEDKNGNIMEAPSRASSGRDHREGEPLVAIHSDFIHETRQLTCDLPNDVEMTSGGLDEFSIKEKKGEISDLGNNVSILGSMDAVRISEVAISVSSDSFAAIPREVAHIPADSFLLESAIEPLKQTSILPEAPPSYDSDGSSSLGSIPAIVDIEPDSESE